MSKFSNLGHGQAQIPMNLFATWEVDRSSPHCVPRTCSLALGKLVIIKELDKDVQSVFVAAKMQGSKRVLRSDEIFLSSNGLLSTQLELTFSLQYHHFIKRGENTLQLMLQRKKRYKNRSMLGYKTLAVVSVDMIQILQCPIIETTMLDMISASKDRRSSMIVVAQAYITSLQSLPADNERIRNSSGKTNADRFPDAENYSDEETFSSDQEMGSDVNAQEYLETNRRKRKGRRSINRLSSSSRQQNFIKAKLVALLRRFKQAADEGLEPDLVENPSSSRHADVDLDFLYDEIEDLNLSDSYPEGEDNISVISTPKPKLRPFFDRISHSSSQTEISSLHNLHDQDKYSASSMIPAIDLSDGSEIDEDDFRAPHSTHSAYKKAPVEPTSVRRKSSSIIVKKSSFNKLDGASSNDELEATSKPSIVTSQHTNVLPEVLRGDLLSGATNIDLPGSVLLIDQSDRNTWPLLQALRANVSTVSQNVKYILATDRQKHLSTVFTKISSLIQKFVSSNSNQPFRIKLAVAGSDAYMSMFLQHFVEFLSSKSLEWQNYLLFLFIPCGHQLLSRYLSSIDRRYSKLFAHSSWWEFFEKYPLLPTDGEMSPEQAHIFSIMINRVNEYIDESSVVIPLTVAEAMITLQKNNESEESATQRFIPFIMEVIVGEVEGATLATTDSDKDEMASVAMANATVTSGGVAMSSAVPYNVTNIQSPQQNTTPTNSTTSNEQKMGLQVDYWKDKDFTKYTLKSNFRSLHVCRLPNHQEVAPSQGLSLDVVTIGKKNIMRLPGKKGKEKDWESKSQVICPINRLICTSKHQHSLLKVNIDGVEWKDIKFFQLSSYWPSHAKTFPVAVFNSP